ncbi:hypothetical protein QYM36_015620 [Artemia franciscana]|uniref:Reverse transcriptase domain-containing protein n=1 Tax=Artemia franciscana TaxID=6661 RepID=A0AA88HN97_ARTSF|nr:hypothetical protein QYM36_015620 [Artemia franciscana]
MDTDPKAFTMILLIRFKEASNEQRHENQHRFHSSPLSYSTTVQTLQLPVINMFLGFVTAFTSVTHESLWKITVEDGMLVKFIQLLKAYYENCKANVRVLGEVKQGCTLSPVLFNYCTDWVLERKLLSLNGVIMGSGINMSDLDYTDDIVALAADLATAQEMLKDIACLSQLLGMKINTVKTKVMDLKIQLDYQIMLYRQELEKVDSLTYLAY